MNKIKLGETSDYAKVLGELKQYKKLFNMAEIEKLIDKLNLAESTLRKAQDYINSNEEIVHFHSLKKGFNDLVEDYFRKQR